MCLVSLLAPISTDSLQLALNASTPFFGAMTRIMSENPSKLTSSRAGYRSHLTKILQKANDFITKKQATEMHLLSLENIVEQLARKKSILIGLDEKIAALITQPDNIEHEIIKSEEIQDQIKETSWQISKFMLLSILPRRPPSHNKYPNK